MSYNLLEGLTAYIVVRPNHNEGNYHSLNTLNDRSKINIWVLSPIHS